MLTEQNIRQGRVKDPHAIRKRFLHQTPIVKMKKSTKDCNSKESPDFLKPVANTSLKKLSISYLIC